MVGDGINEFEREYAAFDTGDAIEKHSTGSVALRNTVGRDCWATLEEDRPLLWDNEALARRVSVDESWLRILGSNVGPCWRRTGERLGVELVVIKDSGELSIEQ